MAPPTRIQRQLSGLPPIASLTRNPAKIPTVIISWKTQINPPRRALGAISAMYTGDTTQMAPTATPTTTRPRNNTSIDGASAPTNAPVVNKADVTMMTSRRPTRSATMPTNTAPVIAPSRVAVDST